MEILSDYSLQLILLGALIERKSKQECKILADDLPSLDKIAVSICINDSDGVWNWAKDNEIEKGETLLQSMVNKLRNSRMEDEWKKTRSQMTFTKKPDDALELLTKFMEKHCYGEKILSDKQEAK